MKTKPTTNQRFQNLRVIRQKRKRRNKKITMQKIATMTSTPLARSADLQRQPRPRSLQRNARLSLKKMTMMMTTTTATKKRRRRMRS